MLKIESITASIHPDIPLPVAETIREEALLKNAIADAEQDATKTEHMPDARPKEEEQEVDEEANGGEEEEVQPESNEGSELPSAVEQP